ncbi:MAG: NAD(P)/FAD-dependent oxidoreductase [Lachnospiraceae bacterium]|nr:NAD(P)/FAD-dependent oxidoreductase [Lachnospiraceae bacterium]
MFDAAIIGTGPAGLSAALCLALHEKEFIWFGSAAMSDKVEKSEKIANYPGMGLISGKELNEKLRAHAAEMDLKPEEKMVTQIMPMGGSFSLLADNELYEAKTVLLAAGVAQAKGFAGEAELLGRGVSYCATCDGFLYKGKTIAVFCGGARYEHEVEYLAGLAEKVYLFAGYKDCGIDLPNVARIGAVREVYGDMKVRGIRLTDGQEIAVDGFFCLRNAIAPSTLIPGIELDGPHIVVNRSQETNIPGCYAAGDCTGRPYQLTKAVGEGNVAAHAMLDYLAKKP